MWAQVLKRLFFLWCYHAVMVMVCYVRVMWVQGHLIMCQNGHGIMVRPVGWGRLGMVPPPQTTGIGGPR